MVFAPDYLTIRYTISGQQEEMPTSKTIIQILWEWNLHKHGTICPVAFCVLVAEYSKHLRPWFSSPGMQLFLDRNQSNPYSIKFYFIYLTFRWLPHFDIQYLSSPVNVQGFSLTISFSSYYCTVWHIRAKHTAIFSCQDRVKGRFLFQESTVHFL